MAWKYSQSTGTLLDPGGRVVAHGFAGQKDGLNNPTMQKMRDLGPLPQGKYRMTQFFQKHPKVGLNAIELQPDDSNEMYGRFGFFIHGLNPMDPLHSSEGCPVLGTNTTRMDMWISPDHAFEVTA